MSQSPSDDKPTLSASRLSSFWNRPVTGFGLIAVFVVFGICSFFVQRLTAPEVYELRETVKNLTNTVALARQLREDMGKHLNYLPPVLEDQSRAIVAMGRYPPHAQTAFCGAQVTSAGAIMSICKCTGTTGSKCVVFGWRADNKLQMTSYTVQWCSPERDLSLLLPDVPLACTVEALSVTTVSLARGEPVAVAGLPFYKSDIEGSHLQAPMMFYPTQLYASVAAYVGNTFMLLDRSVDPGLYGSAVIGRGGFLQGLVFANHSNQKSGWAFGQPFALVSLVGPQTLRNALQAAEAERKATQSLGAR